MASVRSREGPFPSWGSQDLTRVLVISRQDLDFLGLLSFLPYALSLGALCPHKAGGQAEGTAGASGLVWTPPPYLSFSLTHVCHSSHSCQHESGPHRGAGRGHVWSRVRLGLRWAQVQGWGQVVYVRLDVIPYLDNLGFLRLRAGHCLHCVPQKTLACYRV